MHYKFSFNLGDCETRTKNIKGNAEGGEGQGRNDRQKEDWKEGGAVGWIALRYRA